jgi:phosphoribosyl 1,2-cyclic phosphodiesterase
MKLKFWGVRGSVPVPGPNTIVYGGNTPSVQLINSVDEYFIIDAGTGIRELGKELAEIKKPAKINILISHTHWDHIQGIPFFIPLYMDNFEINFYTSTVNGNQLNEIVDAQMHTNFFPVTKDEVFRAKVNFYEINPNQTYYFNDVKVETFPANHSKGTLIFKITKDSKTFVYMTDNEINCGNAAISDKIKDDIFRKNHSQIDFCRGADYLIHDSMYSRNDYLEKVGWGHSNNVSLAYFSILAEVKNLILFHYDPDYSDEMIDDMLEQTKGYLKKEGSNIHCMAAKESLEINLY